MEDPKKDKEAKCSIIILDKQLTRRLQYFSACQIFAIRVRGGGVAVVGPPRNFARTVRHHGCAAHRHRLLFLSGVFNATPRENHYRGTGNVGRNVRIIMFFFFSYSPSIFVYTIRRRVCGGEGGMNRHNSRPEPPYRARRQTVGRSLWRFWAPLSRTPPPIVRGAVRRRLTRGGAVGVRVGSHRRRATDGDGARLHSSGGAAILITRLSFA